jgi:hypothetical protein
LKVKSFINLKEIYKIEIKSLLLNRELEMRSPRPALASETAKTKKIIKNEELENKSVDIAVKDKIKVMTKNSNISKIIKI